MGAERRLEAIESKKRLQFYGFSACLTKVRMRSSCTPSCTPLTPLAPLPPLTLSVPLSRNPHIRTCRDNDRECVLRIYGIRGVVSGAGCWVLGECKSPVLQRDGARPMAMAMAMATGLAVLALP